MTHTLFELERAFRLSWSADTTCLDAKSLATWHPGNAAHGQCGPTALIVQDLLGGELLIADVSEYQLLRTRVLSALNLGSIRS